MGNKTLASLHAGESGEVADLDAGGVMRRRLLDLGLIRGTKVHCLYSALGKKMSAYLVRGAVIALRRADAKTIHIR